MKRLDIARCLTWYEISQLMIGKVVHGFCMMLAGIGALYLLQLVGVIGVISK